PRTLLFRPTCACANFALDEASRPTRLQSARYLQVCAEPRAELQDDAGRARRVNGPTTSRCSWGSKGLLLKVVPPIPTGNLLLQTPFASAKDQAPVFDQAFVGVSRICG